MEERDRQVRTGGTDHDQLSMRMNGCQRDWLKIFDLCRHHGAVNRPHTTALDEASACIGFRFGKWVVNRDVGGRLRTLRCRHALEPVRETHQVVGYGRRLNEEKVR